MKLESLYTLSLLWRQAAPATCSQKKQLTFQCEERRGEVYKNKNQNPNPFVWISVRKEKKKKIPPEQVKTPILAFRKDKKGEMLGAFSPVQLGQ